MNRIDVLNIFTKSVLFSLSQKVGLYTKKSWSKDVIIDTIIGQDYKKVLEKMTVKQLEIILDEVQLPKTGNKADLIQRIIEHEAKEVHHKRPVNKQDTKENSKPVTTQKKKCPACNSEQAMNAKFCNQCGNKFPKSEKEIQKSYLDWVHEFLEERWRKKADEPYDAFMCFSDWVLEEKEQTDQIKVELSYNPQPDDEGTYLPVVNYSIETPVASRNTFDEDPIYGDIDALDDIYSGPAVSDLLRKLGTTVGYKDWYSLAFEVCFDASVEEEIKKRNKEGKPISFDLYTKCFSFSFS